MKNFFKVFNMAFAAASGLFAFILLATLVVSCFSFCYVKIHYPELKFGEYYWAGVEHQECEHCKE